MKRLSRFLRLKGAHRRSMLRSVLLFGMAGIFLFLGMLIVLASTVRIPDFSTFNERKMAESTKIYDTTGKILLYDVHENIRRTYVPLSEISLSVRNAILAIEDDQFYSHEGVRPTSIIRAFIANLTGGGYRQGGSTITQQVVKNTLLTPEKTISRKVKELILAVKIERSLTKDEILSLYLNETPWGGNLYGVEEASISFFGKSANELSLAESAYLAAIPKAPTYYSPHGNHRVELDARKNLVLRRMLEVGFITQAEHDTAKTEVVTFLVREKYGIKAPHFVIWVKEYLAEKYGEEAVEEGGLKVITSLNYEIQSLAEETIAEYAATNETNFNAKNAGMIAIDPNNGHILAMVGSRDYFDMENEGNFNITLARRQPGSAFKPFVYATGFTKGYGPETILFDLPTQFDTGCGFTGGGCYTPENYDGEYRGPMSLRNALAQSINVPAVKMLYLSGITDSLETARRMGITTLTDKSRYGLTLVLGGGEVSLLELTSAYGVFANEGVRNPYVSILRVEDREGKVLEEFAPHAEEVLDQNAALLISDILSDNVARTPLYGERSSLYFEGRDVAAKTGTTNDYRDTWIVGYTPNLVLGAWAGNNDNSPMEKKVAGLIVAPMWRAVMEKAIEKFPIEDFTPPIHGADERMPAMARGILVDPQNPQVHSLLYWLKKDDPFTRPQNPYDDPQFPLWEIPVQNWIAKNGQPQPTIPQFISQPPIEQPDNQ
ncbi:MAG: hypothetical protein A2408_03295 [Candidatus Yonathbacteria bacterium RIFOXYC1_FULL_52_10]|nr:MAG: hypothetical protein A2408_03295 [Candidatus Yonathbacteria bacterium RIFOXYC1_FULL_52_10]